MDHETAWGLLEELGAGRLAPEVEADVRGHVAGCAECRSQLEMLEWLRTPAVRQAGRRTLDGHPSVDQMVRLVMATRELDRQNRDYLRRHLLACRKCRDEVAALRGARAAASPWRMALEDFLDAPVRQWAPAMAPVAAAALAVILVGAYTAVVELPAVQQELHATRLKLPADVPPAAPPVARPTEAATDEPPVTVAPAVPAEPRVAAGAADAAGLQARVDSLGRLVAVLSRYQLPVETLVLGEEHAEPVAPTGAAEGLKGSAEPAPGDVPRVHVHRGQAAIPISITQLPVTLGLRGAESMRRPLLVRISRAADGAEALSHTLIPAEHWRPEANALVLYAPAAALTGGDLRLEVLDDPGGRVLYSARFSVVTEN
jgi:hypothetical protein